MEQKTDRIKEAKELRFSIIKKHIEKTDDKNGINTFFSYHEAMQEYAELYHSMKCEEAGRELPNNEDLIKKYPVEGLNETWTNQNIAKQVGAIRMRSEASLIISSLTSKLEEANKEIERLKNVAMLYLESNRNT